MIDSITYNDLNLDDIYNRINSCKSTAGEEFLKNHIINPYDDNRDDFIYLINNTDKYIADKPLVKVGKLKNRTFTECLGKLISANSDSNLKHYLCGAFVVITFGLLFVSPGPGLLSLFVAIGVSLYLYFKEQKNKSLELYAYAYICRMTRECTKITSQDERIKRLLDETVSIKKALSPVIRGSFLIKTNISTDGNPIDILLDYLRMIFHVDLIKYNNVLKCIKSEKESVQRLFEIYGLFDAAKAVREFRDGLKFYSEPAFTTEKHLLIEDCYHPLLDNPVLNSIDTNKGVLITGSNASGKSTFLKTAALCIIFAQSFDFSFSRKMILPKCEVYSSMALRDDISAGESYFIKEIKSLKRIVDSKNKEDFIICFIDEVLRGTNTIERIAAAKEILSDLEENNSICFAATHDIELATLLNDKYDNYHFSEEFKENDVIFSYKLLSGKTNSRNALKLLNMLGYDKQIVERSEKLVTSFVDTGKWQ